MVGEQMAVTLGITAAGPISQLEVVVKAEYLEGGGHSELQILLPDAEEDRPSLQVRLFLLRRDNKKDARHVCAMPCTAVPQSLHCSASSAFVRYYEVMIWSSYIHTYMYTHIYRAL